MFDPRNNQLLLKEQLVPLFIRKIKRICRSESGVVAIEFAMVLPVLVVMYLGMVVTVIGTEINHKLALVAESLGDLTGRMKSVTDADLIRLFGASKWLISPHSATPIRVNMGSISRNAAGTELKCWAVNISNASSPPIVTNITPPSLADLGLQDNYVPNRTSILFVEVVYLYRPLTNLFSPDITLVQRYYTRPRNSLQVEKVLSNGTSVACPVP